MHEQNGSQPKAFIKILFALFTALLVVVLGYLCIQIYTIFHRTYKTETAIAYTMSDNITLKGVAVFQAVDVPGSGNLGYVVQDGERVSAGTILAEQYTDDSQGAMRERLGYSDGYFDLSPEEIAELSNHQIYRVDGLLKDGLYYSLISYRWSRGNWYL